MNHRIVAVALLTEPELRGLGAAFDRAWPVEEASCFSGLLEAIDKADRELWRERDRQQQAKAAPCEPDAPNPSATPPTKA